MHGNVTNYVREPVLLKLTRPVSLLGTNCYILLVSDCWVCNKVVKQSLGRKATIARLAI